ncbi:hypothetical protein HDV00_002988 [Rhizophlyctis rosea]|nr:hypothetical protein HDV00_002988 [Rhizophlyctis rosea]
MILPAVAPSLPSPNPTQSKPAATNPGWICWSADQKFKGPIYAVKNPTKLQLEDNPTPDIARQQEREFFKNHPWNHSTYREVLGVGPYRSKVGAMLIPAIDEGLPEIKATAESLLNDCRKRLKSLPPLPAGKPTLVLLKLVDAYATVVREQAHAKHGNNDFWCWRKAEYEAMRDEIEKTSPKLVISKDTVKGKPEEGEEWTIRDVRVLIEKELGRNLTGFIPPTVFQRMVRHFEESWEIWRWSFWQGRKASKEVGQFPKLAEVVRNVATELLEQCSQATESLLYALFQSERPYAFTLDLLFDTKRQRAYKQLTAQYTETCLPAAAELSASASSPPSTQAPTASVLKLMAHVKAYFNIASSRFVDHAATTMDRFLVLGFADGIANKLRERFDDESEEEVKGLISEAPEVQKERNKLEAKEARLKEVLKLIAEFRL